VISPCETTEKINPILKKRNGGTEENKNEKREDEFGSRFYLLPFRSSTVALFYWFSLSSTNAFKNG
jgi:hypothetical protein